MLATAQNFYTQNRKELTRFMKFAVVGAIGAVVDFSILNFFRRIIGWPLVISNTISFTCAVFSNFIWNRYWTYPDSRSKPLTAQLGQFSIVNIVGLAINTTILLLLEPPMTQLAISLGIATTALAANTYGDNAAKVVATGVVMFWNFFINRLWTYNDAK